MSQPKISVIMLTYNRQQFVSRAIESILAQTFTDYEFIIVDNGSTDQSGKISDGYAKQDSRIQVLHRDKGTIGAGRNSGLDMTRGEYITFIDDDDYAEPQMLAFLYDLAEKYQADIALCGSYKIIGNERIDKFVYDELFVWDTKQAIIEYLKRQKFSAGMPTKLFGRNIFEQIRFREDSRYDDIAVGYQCFTWAKRVAACGKPLYYACRHETNNSRAAISDDLLYPEQLEAYLAAFAERTNYLREYLPETADYAQYSEWSYMISMYHKITTNQLTNCYLIREKMEHVLLDNYDAFYNSAYIQEFERQWMRQYLREDVEDEALQDNLFHECVQ